MKNSEQWTHLFTVFLAMMGGWMLGVSLGVYGLVTGVAVIVGAAAYRMAVGFPE